MDLDYAIENTTDPIRLVLTVRVNNFNTASWNGATGFGMYLGIGYGCDEMENCDMTWCNYAVTGTNGASTDKFVCNDVKTNSSYFPI